MNDMFAPIPKRSHSRAPSVVSTLAEYSLSRHYTTIHQRTLEGKDRTDDRRRIAKACKPCNISKVRCDGEQPCHRCRNNGTDCYYEASQKRKILETPATTNTSSKRLLAESPFQHVEDYGQSARKKANVAVAEAPTAQPGQGHVTSTAFESMSDNGTFGDTPSTIYEGFQPFNSEGTELENLSDFDLDMNFFPSLFDFNPGVERSDSLWPALKEPERHATVTPVSPTPLTPAEVAEIYNRSLSPTLEGEAMEPRQYKPSSINLDAQLSFPDMEHIPMEEVDQENLAHVPEISNIVVGQMAQLALTIQTTSTFPSFVELRMPPSHVINAWVQLYFEHFHPVFPFLHKPSFGTSDTHWLLIFAVSAIGAQFSGLPQSQACSRAMNEIVRRSTSYLCENRNQNGRELWLTQVILLNQLALRYSGERRALEIAELLQALPVTLARRKRLFTNYLPHERVSHLDLPLDQKWQIWTLDEERRRTGFAIWLIDSAFETDFDLTSVMRVHEMQNSLPQEEKPWLASTAQAWAGFPARMATKSPQTLLQLVSNASCTAIWNKTGVLGKSAILQQLFHTIQKNRLQTLYSASYVSVVDCTAAVDALRQILILTYHQRQELPMNEMKALSAHRIIILSALMMNDLPKIPLLSTVLKVKYKRYSNSDLGQLERDWSSSPQKTRQAIVYAADLFETVRSTNCTHYSTPVLLFQAALVLWLYSVILGQPQDYSDTTSVVIGTSNQGNEKQTQWIETGRGRIKMSGVGNISSPSGLGKLLDESISVMRTLRWWGISKIYEQLLVRLRATQKHPAELEKDNLHTR
ncbi:hypothetical protein N7447_010267 [Penicillium robsamsonii]|uniref:uncharacterized protein n=1 Tax=Penicillium robsamsonii TaxID=1792511 RepID=UPI00254933B2|nr:uncharacterized protein N7447_010267 [Penicillium robsamsonii]KAJ5813244.1 hypothetical protein N7447_010267 [Penicillium robsamsonii]